ncbi:phage late control D family protein [Palleronia caenipelagi]|uniref:Phage tail protein n=1 Tax=Palleronia caenipelagi TaxID=2489174 RepID=A0A547PWD7_9RHOB|nr:contractile injection system protein, VgrG/Pvc8 family [Palleronia caenipelagi]TRD18404.1 phage tail protein [Palleronia caenipelagi]
MQIAFQIRADGADITGRVNDRLLGLSVIDEAGAQADRAEITLDNRDMRLALPSGGAVLEIALGYRGALVALGRFVVDEVTGGIGPDTITLHAKAADMLGPIRARKTRAWTDQTLGQIARTIAGEHGLTAKVAASLASVAYPYLAQTAESDLNLLTRLARDLDAVAKPAGGALVVLPRDATESAGGTALPVTPIQRSEITSGRWKITGRGLYGKVTAQWGDRGAGAVQTVTEGDGTPVLALRHRHPTEEAARRAARAALTRNTRAAGQIDLTLGGFRGDLMAGAEIGIAGLLPELDGRWRLTRVTHRLGTTLATSLTAERGTPEMTETETTETGTTEPATTKTETAP